MGDQWAERWRFQGSERVQFNSICESDRTKEAYILYAEDYRRDHPRTCGNSIMRRWRGLADEDRDAWIQEAEEEAERRTSLAVAIDKRWAKGMPDDEVKQRDLHEEWRDEIPLHPGLNYHCVKVLYNREPQDGEVYEVRTVVLLYVGFDEEDRARDVSTLSGPLVVPSLLTLAPALRNEAHLDQKPMGGR